MKKEKNVKRVQNRLICVEKEYMSEPDDTNYFMMQGIDQQVQGGEYTGWESDDKENKRSC